MPSMPSSPLKDPSLKEYSRACGSILRDLMAHLHMLELRLRAPQWKGAERKVSVTLGEVPMQAARVRMEPFQFVWLYLVLLAASA